MAGNLLKMLSEIYAEMIDMADIEDITRNQDSTVIKYKRKIK